MTLTHEDLQVLQAPFALDDHEFINGYVYIREDAITARIEQIDPSWGLIQSDYVIIDGQYNVSVNLVIKGVTRVGIGTAQAIFKNERLVNEPLKSAVTDALKRAARLFGIGRYLLQAPKERDFSRWLAGLSGGQPANVQRTSPKPAERRVPPPAPAQDDKPKNVSGHLLSIEKRKDKNNRDYMLIEISGGHKASVWSWSTTFGLAGYDATIDFTYADDEKLMPNRKIDVKLQLDDNGYYSVSEIAPKS